MRDKPTSQTGKVRRVQAVIEFAGAAEPPPEAGLPCVEAGQEAGRGPVDLKHSPDFACVVWRGQEFTFSRKQRLVVAALFRAWDDGVRWVSQDNLLDAAESDGGRLRNVFARHPAWGTLIVSGMDEGGTPGTYRLAV